MNKYLFIGGEFNGQWLEASGDKEIVFAEAFADCWNMVCYERQEWIQRQTLFEPRYGRRTQEIYVLDSLSDAEATQLMHGR